MSPAPLRPCVSDVEVLKERWHQDWVTHDVTVIHVPLIRRAFAFLQRVLWVVGTGELLWATKTGSWLTPAVWSVCRRCSSAGSFEPIQGRVPAACRGATLPRISAATVPKARRARARSSIPARGLLGPPLLYLTGSFDPLCLGFGNLSGTEDQLNAYWPWSRIAVPDRM